MARNLAAIWSPLWRTAVVLLSVQIAATSASRYLTGGEAPPAPILANAFADPFLAIHAASGIIVLLLGPMQFVRRIRERAPALHRGTGRVYVAACAVAAPSGLLLAFGTAAGPVAGAGFAVSALLLAVFVYLGVRAAVERRIEAHREWMLRGYALIAGAITLRLMLPATNALGLDFFPAYQVIAWLSWLVNLGAVEWYIRRKRGASGGYPALATA